MLRSSRYGGYLAASLLAGLLAVGAGGASPVSAKPVSKAGSKHAPKAPAGNRFYSPPKRLYKGRAGTTVWSRPARGLSRLPAAARTVTVIYRSTSLKDKPTVMSGTIAVPKGTPPKGGWPIVSWGHVTTGSADLCAPSRVTPGNTELERLTRGDQMTNHLLELGVAVARADFEGIGTPGGHPYMIGKSLGRSMVDIVRAGRTMRLNIGRRWATSGHSEGGQAALFAAAMGPRRAPELKLKAASAFAPASHISNILELARLINVVSPLTAGLTPLGGLILEGAALQDPGLRTDYEAGGLSPQALALMPQVETRCLNDLALPDSFGGLAPAMIAGPNADVVLPEVYKVLDANDPRVLKMPGLPVRLDQGAVDFVVMKWHTDEVAEALTAGGSQVTYDTWAGASHTDITNVDVAGSAAADWLKERLK